MNDTIDIKHRDHFKLTIALKDKIVFETELQKNGISFHIDDNPLAPTRYFLLDKDRNRIDGILKENGIIASTDTIAMTDYSDAKKVYKIYLYVAAVVVLLFVIAIVILDYAKK
jgi:hypothetical protein